MFFKSDVKKKCFCGKAIDSVQETKYFGVMLNSKLKMSIDVSRQTHKF